MPFDLSLKDLVQEIKTGKILAETVMNEVYDRIDQYNSSLNAYRSLLPRETAIERARQLDQKISKGESPGALAGIPVSVKDNICVQDPELSNACGSKILGEYHSPYHATVVEKLLNEDALIIGTTNMDEFAMGSSTENSAFEATRNPWDPERVPGGSSGGSAVAAVTGMALLTLGSDTGGSVRQPASLCGVTGMKPSYGTVSRYGLVAYGSSLDQIGFFGRSAEDCHYAFSLLHGNDSHESTSSIKPLPEAADSVKLDGLKICLPKEYIDAESADPDVISSVQEMVKVLEANNVTVEQRSLEFLKFVIPTYYVIAFAEASSNLGRFDGVRYGNRKQQDENLKSMYSTTRKEGFGDEVKRRIMLGTFVLSSGYYDQYYGQALNVRAWMEKEVAKLFEDFDFILGPVSPFPAFKLGEKTEDPLTMYLADIYSVLANLTRCPAVSLPGTPSKDGLPIGIQLMGRRFEDHKLMRVGTELQKITDHHKRLPF